MPHPPPEGKAGSRLFEGFLMVVGILMMLASGLCSGMFLSLFPSDAPGQLGVVLLYGGVPFGFGLLMFLAGLGFFLTAR